MGWLIRVDGPGIFFVFEVKSSIDLFVRGLAEPVLGPLSLWLRYERFMGESWLTWTALAEPGGLFLAES